ncbi:MAG: aminodeoxychorismate/anthranilate synthase component II [Vampirovibrio sp.]|nr:aminodeoxychorismate/anthranilate synthase component II [Vampirovibrio sp.]
MTILLIDNYDSFTYNLYQMTQALTEEPVEVFRNDAIDFEKVKTLSPSRIILSPGPGHPAVDKDFGVCRDILEKYDELNVPLLGVCLGHQGLVHTFGGAVTKAPAIVHGKTSMVDVLSPSPLLENLPNPFEAMRYHSLVAADEKFPDVLQILARDKTHNLIMAVRHREKPLYGVQFHPESIGTPQGTNLLRNFIHAC